MVSHWIMKLMEKQPQQESSGTYKQPTTGWLCFHCGERFMSVNAARDHFGVTPASTTACILGVKGIQKELRALRWAEFDNRVRENDGKLP